MGTIILEKADSIATITLNRPKRLNTINKELAGELKKALADIGLDEKIRVLILTGAGKAFCAGGDFRYSEVKAGRIAPGEAEDVSSLYEEIRTGRLPPESSSLFINLINLEKPTIAMINGDAIGGGLDLALCCDMRVAADNARFSVGFTRIGLTPDSGGTWLLPRLIGLGRALEMIYTSDFYSAEQVYNMGLLHKVVALAHLKEEISSLAAKLAEGPPIALRLSKLQVLRGLGMDFETALTAAAAYLNLTASSNDHLEGIKAFVEKRKPRFKGT